MFFKTDSPRALAACTPEYTPSLCKLTGGYRGLGKCTRHFKKERKKNKKERRKEIVSPRCCRPGRERTHLTRFPIRDSRYLRAESCPSSLLYPLVNRPSACLVGLHGNTTTTHRGQCALLAGSENPASAEDQRCFWL